MRKHKITRKLILYFTSVLLLFSLVVGMFFLTLFSKYTLQVHRMELEKRAVVIADALSLYFQNADADMENAASASYEGTSNPASHGSGYGKGAKGSGKAADGGVNRFTGGKGTGQYDGYRGYIRFINDVAMDDVWVVDRDAQTIIVGSGKQEINYSQLPEGAVEIVEDVFEGNVAYGEGFSDVLQSPSLTVGAPVYDENKTVIAAVLLHGYVDGADDATRSGMGILIASLVLAMMLGIVLSVILARHFIRPLQTMERITKELADGDYSAKTGIRQKDEIGSLAQHIDLLAERLDDASKEREKMEEMRRAFIANISHELRTPVTVMRGSLEALSDGVVEQDKLDEYYRQMLSESIHLERMVNDLLELSRLQNTDYHIEKTPINLVETVEDAVRSMRQIAREKNVAVQLHKELQSYILNGDYARLRQMFMIILDNAVKFSAENATVEVVIKQEENHTMVAISDCGSGILPEEMEHIFERFYKSSDGKNQKGTGLGLAIARQIAQRHGAQIDVESEPNVKTEFRIIFYEEALADITP